MRVAAVGRRATCSKRVDELTIRAPFDGMVASVAVQDRDAVAPNQAVLTVVNLSSLELEIALPEEYAGETAIGTPATISFNGREYQGKVTADLARGRGQPGRGDGGLRRRAAAGPQTEPAPDDAARVRVEEGRAESRARRVRRRRPAAAAPTSSTARWPPAATITLGATSASEVEVARRTLGRGDDRRFGHQRVRDAKRALR